MAGHGAPPVGARTDLRDGAVRPGTVAAMSWWLTWLGVAYGAFLGGAFASFGCVVSERVPAGRGLNGRSRCACGRQLRAHENVPVLGWVLARGRARCCGAPLPVRYLAWEVAYGLWGAAVLGWAWRQFVHGDLTAGSATATAVAFAAAFPVLLLATWQRPQP